VQAEKSFKHEKPHTPPNNGTRVPEKKKGTTAEEGRRCRNVHGRPNITCTNTISYVSYKSMIFSGSAKKKESSSGAEVHHKGRMWGKHAQLRRTLTRAGTMTILISAAVDSIPPRSAGGRPERLPLYPRATMVRSSTDSEEKKMRSKSLEGRLRLRFLSNHKTRKSTKGATRSASSQQMF